MWHINFDFADVVISCRYFELTAHKIILVEVSPVLKKEFKTKNVLSWSFMNKEELILIIELIYKGEVRVEKEQVSKVLEIHTGFQST